MVSIRSDDIRGRWGRLIDNTASFTSLDLSGQASGITAAISGQILAGSVSGQISGFTINPSAVVVASGLSGVTINVQSGIVAGQLIISGTATFGGAVIMSGVVSGLLFQMGLSNYIIHKDTNGNYVTRNMGSGGIVIITNTNPDDTIASTLALGAGDIEIAAGTIKLSASFSGWGPRLNTRVKLRDFTTVLVPQGYSGAVWNVLARGTQIRVEGGYYLESGAGAQNLWTGLRVIENSGGSAYGIDQCMFENMKFDACDRGITLNVERSGGYINGNIFRNIKIFNPNVAVEFSGVSTIATALCTTNDNTFIDIFHQSANRTSGGFINVMGQRNVFVNCKNYDMNTAAASAITTSFASASQHNIIMGGIMTYNSYQDFGTSGTNLVMDAFNDTILGDMTVQTIGPISGGNTVRILNPSSGQMNLAMHSTPSGNNANFFIYGSSGTNGTSMQLQNAGASMSVIVNRHASGSSVKPLFFTMVDSINNTTVQYMNVTRSGDITFGQSGGNQIFERSLAIGTNASGINFSGLQMLPSLSPTTYFIWVSGSTYRGANTLTGIIEASGTEAGAVFNTCINNSTSGCSIAFRGIHTVSTSIVVKNFVSIYGHGQKSTLVLASGANTDIILSQGFSGLTGTNSTSGVTSVVLKDFVIDGNRVNNSSGYGIHKYGYNWILDGLMIRNCGMDGIYSEWSTSTSPPNPDSMEETWSNIKVHHSSGVNIRYRGPHDSHWYNVIAYAGNSGNCHIESAATYDGGIEMHGCHFWGATTTTTSLLIHAAAVGGINIISEGSDGVGGIGIHVRNGATLRANRVHTFANETGLILDSQNNDVDVYSYNNQNGVLINSAFNKLTGKIETNSGIGLIMSASGGSSIADCTIDVRMRGNTTHVDWRTAGINMTRMRAHIATQSGETAISGTPNTVTNEIKIYCEGSGTNYKTENRGVFLGSGNDSTTIYTIAHGLSINPTQSGYINVMPASVQARASGIGFDVSGNASSLIVTYQFAPNSGNVKLTWVATG